MFACIAMRLVRRVVTLITLTNVMSASLASSSITNNASPAALQAHMPKMENASHAAARIVSTVVPRENALSASPLLNSQREVVWRSVLPILLSISLLSTPTNEIYAVFLVTQPVLSAVGLIPTDVYHVTLVCVAMTQC